MFLIVISSLKAASQKLFFFISMATNHVSHPLFHFLIWTEMGIEEGKAKVSYGKPSNLSVILVKFPPIRSGFELAGKLHNHFYQAKHGKEHLHDLLKSGNSTTSNKKANEKEIEDVLYGYMAGIEDLENLDSDTKKTYLAGKDTIRSKKVMEARANEEAAA